MGSKSIFSAANPASCEGIPVIHPQRIPLIHIFQSVEAFRSDKDRVLPVLMRAGPTWREKLEGSRWVTQAVYSPAFKFRFDESYINEYWSCLTLPSDFPWDVFRCNWLMCVLDGFFEMYLKVLTEERAS